MKTNIVYLILCYLLFVVGMILAEKIALFTIVGILGLSGLNQKNSSKLMSYVQYFMCFEG